MHGNLLRSLTLCGQPIFAGEYRIQAKGLKCACACCTCKWESQKAFGTPAGSQWELRRLQLNTCPPVSFLCLVGSFSTVHSEQFPEHISDDISAQETARDRTAQPKSDVTRGARKMLSEARGNHENATTRGSSFGAWSPCLHSS